MHTGGKQDDAKRGPLRLGRAATCMSRFWKTRRVSAQYGVPRCASALCVHGNAAASHSGGYRRSAAPGGRSMLTFFPRIKAAHPGKIFCRPAFHARGKLLRTAALRASKDHRQRDPAAHPAYRTRRKRLNSLYAPAQFDILRLKRDHRPPPLRACAKTCDRRSRSALRAAWHIGRALENSAAHRCFPLMGKRPRHACRAQTKTAAPGLRASEFGYYLNKSRPRRAGPDGLPRGKSAPPRQNENGGTAA